MKKKKITQVFERAKSFLEKIYMILPIINLGMTKYLYNIFI